MNQNGSSLIEMMISLVILGIVVSGTYDGLAYISRENSSTAMGAPAEEIAEQALLVLEALPADSAALLADGDANDLFDTATPDKTADPQTGTSPWIISKGATQYRLVYNVAREALAPNTAQIQIHVFWEENGTPPQLPSHPMRTTHRALFRKVAPL